MFIEQNIMISKMRQQELEAKSRHFWKFSAKKTQQEKPAAAPITREEKCCGTVICEA